MRRFARVTIATAVLAGAIAVPGGASASGPLDDVATALGCTSGQDGIRCSAGLEDAQEAVKSRRVCRRGTRSYRGCMTRGHREPLQPPGLTR